MQSKYFLLELLKEMVEDAAAGMGFEEDVQPGDGLTVETPLKVSKMRLPNSRHAAKYAPYCILQYVTGTHRQPEGKRSLATATVRMIFCVHDEDEETGALRLLNLMERVERRLLEDPFFGKGFQLDRESGPDDLIYTDDTRPYYAGEILATFIIKETERNVREWLLNH